MRPSAAPVGTGRSPASPPSSAGRRRSSRCSSSSSRRSTSSGSLRPPAANSLMPLSAKGLCDADTIAAGAPSDADHQATAGVGTTPSSTTSTPSLARPAASAASSMGPDRRVSRPTAQRSPPSTRAAARPRARASSGVSSALATPRTPSVPNFNTATPRPTLPPATALAGPRRSRPATRPAWRCSPRSALAVLWRLAGLLQAVLLRLLHPRVAGEEARPLERDPQLGVELNERAGDAEPERPGLAGHAAAAQGGVDVVGLGRVGEPQRLGEHHAVRPRREVALEVATVDRDLPGAGAQPDAGDGALAAAGGLHEWRRHRSGVLWWSGGAVAGVRHLEGLGLLGGVRVRRAGVDLQLGALAPAEAVLRQHAAHRPADGLLRLAAVQLGEGLGADAARVARVPPDDLAVGLARREHDLVGVHDDDVVAGVDVGREDRLVLAPQDAGDLARQATEDHALGVHDVPGPLDL